MTKTANKILNSSIFAVFTMLVWEIVEEGLETLIAYAISSTVAWFVVKALSALTIVGATVLTKTAIKAFLFPFFRKLIYKKGNDKTQFILTKGAKLMKYLKANKFSFIYGIIVGAVTGFGIWLALETYASLALWLNICTSIAGGLFGFVLTFLLGKDTVLTYLARVNAKKLGNEKFAQVIAESERLIEEIKAKEAEEKALEEAKAKAKAELVAKQEAEIEALARKKVAENKIKALSVATEPEVKE